MKNIKKVGRLQPMISVPYFHSNPSIYIKLRAGQVVSVPDHIFEGLKGVEEVKEEKEVKKRYSSSKSKYKAYHEVKSEPEDLE